jgi:hypothetical protein
LKRRAALAALVLVAISGCTALRGRFAGPDILFVATPEAVSVEMLRVAEVTGQDVVFDLGSGDGRVVIAAARDFGARGVGVEIDPTLVKTSKDAALAAGVGDRATFLWQDLFVTDVREATVVTLYLRDDVNLKLRPKLFDELAPGTRVVSHDFDMGDWKADRIQRVQGPTRLHTLYLWLIPARVAGTWQTRVGDRDATLTLTQRYQTIAGTLALDGNQVPIADGKLEGNRLTLTAGTLTLTGVVIEDTIEGRADDRSLSSSDWTARRAR